MAGWLAMLASIVADGLFGLVAGAVVLAVVSVGAKLRPRKAPVPAG